MVNIIGWTITILMTASGLLRRLTVDLHIGTLQRTLPTRHPVAQAGKIVLRTYAVVLSVVAIVGSIALPLPGIYGPVLLVFAVFWQVNKGWKIRYLPWVAPVEYGLEDGEKIVLLGGAVATLIGYLWTLPAQ